MARRRFFQKMNERICCFFAFLLFTAKKNKFVCSFFGRMYGAQICLRFYLTFINLQRFEISKTTSKTVCPHYVLSTSRRLHTYLFFAEVYDACRYKWTLGRALTEWYADMKPAFRRCMSFIKEVVTSNWFEYTICKSAFHLIKR